MSFFATIMGTLQIQPQDQFSYILMFSIGILVVISFAWQRFNEPSYQPVDDEPITCIKPMHLALQSQFTHMRLLYSVALAWIYTIFTLLYPIIFNEPATKNVPIYVAFVLTGVIPSIPWVEKIEKFIRGLMHKLAMIPKGVQEIATALQASGFYFDSYLPLMDKNMFSSVDKSILDNHIKPANKTLRWRWAVACCVMYNLKYHMTNDCHDLFDQKFFKIYKKDFYSLKRDHMLIDRQMRDYISEIDGLDTTSLENEFDDYLERLFTFVGCAVRLHNKNDGDVREALREMGFQMDQGYRKVSMRDTIILGLGAIFIIVFTTAWMGKMLFDTIPEPLPQNLKEAIQWAVIALAAAGAISISVLSWRSTRRAKGKWFKNRQLGKRSVTNYAISGAIGAAVGIAVFYIFSAIFHESTPLILKNKIVWFPIFSVLSIGLVSTLDNQNEKRFLWIWEGIWMGVALLIVTAISTRIWLFFNGFDVNELSVANAKFTIYMGILAGMCGFAIGSIIPSGQRREKKERKNSALAKREQEVIIKLTQYIPNKDRLIEWLDTKNENLGNVPPRVHLTTSPGIRRVLEEIEREYPTN